MWVSDHQANVTRAHTRACELAGEGNPSQGQSETSKWIRRRRARAPAGEEASAGNKSCGEALSGAQATRVSERGNAPFSQIAPH